MMTNEPVFVLEFQSYKYGQVIRKEGTITGVGKSSIPVDPDSFRNKHIVNSAWVDRHR